jgi:hypothetical protein
VGLVAEMRSGLEQLLNGDDGCRHGFSPSGYASTEPSNPELNQDTGMSGSVCGIGAP